MLQSPLLLISVSFALGVLFRVSGLLPSQTSVILNRYVIWIALPALILFNIPKLSVTFSVFYPVAFAWGLLAIIALLVITLAKKFAWSSNITCALLLLAPLGNTSFVGLPLVSLLIGESAVATAIIYDQLGSFLALAIYGSSVIAIYSQKTSVEPLHWMIVKKVMTFPPFIALLSALLLPIEHLPDEIKSSFDWLGWTLVPAVMVSVGFQWRLKLLKRYWSATITGLSLKLLVMPLIAWVALLFVELEAMVEHTILLESAMAPMISAGALLLNEDVEREFVAGMIGYGLLFGFLTVPLFHYVYGL